MPLVTCPDCGKQVSDRAGSCPNCGCPIEQLRDEILIAEQLRKEQARHQEEIVKLEDEKEVQDNLEKHERLLQLRSEKKLRRPTPFAITIWTVFAIIVVFAVFLFLALTRMADTEPEPTGLMLLCISAFAFAIYELVLLVQMYNWKKRAFSIFLSLSIGSFVLNLVLGVPLLRSLLSLLVVGVIFSVMQFKIDGVRIWDLME